MAEVNVLHLVWDNPVTSYGGIQSQIARHLKFSKSRNTVRVLPSFNLGVLRGGIDDLCLALHNLEDEIKQVCASARIDVVHSHNLHRNHGLGIASRVCAAVRCLSLLHVTTIHDFVTDISRDEVSRQGSILQQCTRVTTSGYVQSQLLRGTGLRSRIIAPCYQDNLCLDCSGERNGHYIVTSPGRVLPQKGVFTAAVLAGYLSERLGPLTLRLSSVKTPHNGGSSETAAILQQIQSSFRYLTITFQEQIPEVAAMFRGAHLTLCLPDSIEGFGLTPLESIMAEVPVLLAPNGGLEWARTVRGIQTCNLSDLPGVAEMAAEMLIEKERWRCEASAGKQVVSDLYGPERFESQYLAVYKGIRDTGPVPEGSSRTNWTKVRKLGLRLFSK